MKNPLDSRITQRWAKRFTKQKLQTYGRTMAPTLFAFTLATAAHAQGSIDLTGAHDIMTAFKTFAMYAGAICCLGGLIFAGIRLMGGRFQEAIPGLFGALFGAGVLGCSKSQPIICLGWSQPPREGSPHQTSKIVR